MAVAGGKDEALKSAVHDIRPAIATLKFARICGYISMTKNEFERKIRKLGRNCGAAVFFDCGRGKGSHGRLYYGNRFTMLKDRSKEIGPDLLNAMLAQLGLTKADLEDLEWRSAIAIRWSGKRTAGGSSALQKSQGADRRRDARGSAG